MMQRDPTTANYHIETTVAYIPLLQAKQTKLLYSQIFPRVR